jgi:glucose-6-phosphate 1-epimerase
MADFGDEEYQRMVCLEAGVIKNPIKLSAGEEWIATMNMSVS